MIKNEFLGLKYNGIKNLYELNASNGVMRKIGWNCRKYIRWAEVHESENDREILISAGNSLVDDNTVPVALMGSVNQVLLNVQKWRLDKEYFSVEPNHRSDYQKLSVLISQEKLDEKYAASYLFDKNIDTPNLSERIQEIFYVTIIIDFFEGVTKQKFPKPIDYDNVDDAFLDYMRVVYDFHGLKLQKGIDIRECLRNIFNDLGLDINFTSDRKQVANTKNNIKNNIIKYVKMQPAKLIKINYISGNKLIELNINNLYIKKIIKNEQAKVIIESMINAMADSYHCLVDHQDSIDIFFSYLALKLNDEIRDIDD